MSNTTPVNESALSWGHPGLDKICYSLRDFDSLLIVFRDVNTFKWAQNLAKQSLIPKSQQAGLYLSEFNLSTESASQLENQLKSDSPDALVAMSSETDRDRLGLLCSQVNKLPVALIALFQVAPKKWELYFENCVEISEGSAVIRWRDGRPPVQMPFSMDQVKPQEIPTIKERIVLVGCDDKREALLRRAMENNQYDIKKMNVNDPGIEGAALVIYEEPWVEQQTESDIQRLSSLSTVFISTAPMRMEDRVRCYRAGARLVLTDKPAIEELSAAVKAYLSPKSERNDPFAKLDNEERKLSSRIRRETFWTKKDLEKASVLYKPLIANHFSRAQLLDADIITIMVKIPQAPKEIAVSGWQNVFQKALVNAMISSLRSRDLTFTIDDTLIVMISAVHSIATKPVLKRMQAHLAQLSAPSVSASIIVRKSSIDASPADEADKLIQDVFQSEKFQYKELGQWINPE